jgi:hypothetical protein
MAALETVVTDGSRPYSGRLRSDLARLEAVAGPN